VESKKENKPELRQSLSEFLIHILIVCILTGIIFYVSSKTILNLFGEKIYILILLGICSIYMINFTVKKIYRLIKKMIN